MYTTAPTTTRYAQRVTAEEGSNLSKNDDTKINEGFVTYMKFRIFRFLSRKSGHTTANFEPLNHLFTQNFYCNEKDL